jgi:hypothetical protein
MEFLPKLGMDRPHIEFRGSEVDIVGMRNRHDADIHGVFEINGFPFLLGLAQTVGDEGFAKPVFGKRRLRRNPPATCPSIRSSGQARHRSANHAEIFLKKSMAFAAILVQSG